MRSVGGIGKRRERSARTFIEKEQRIIKFRGDPNKITGFCEVRGIVNKDGSMSFGEFTQFDPEFGKSIS